MHLPIYSVEDKWRWMSHMKGRYSSKGSYDLLLKRKGVTNGVEEEIFKLVWNHIAPTNVRVHKWRVIQERNPTTTKFQRWRVLAVNVYLSCAFCKSSPETVRLFSSNARSRIIFVWTTSRIWNIQILSSNPSTNILHFSRLLKGKERKILRCAFENVSYGYYGK